MKHRAFSLAVVILFVCTGADYAHANRINNHEIPAPEMIFEPDACLVPERIVVRFESDPNGSRDSRTASRVAFQLANICDQDRTYRIRFDGGRGNAGEELSFAGSIRLTVNGRETTLQEEQKATHDGKDITGELAASGLPLDLPVSWYNADEENRKYLIQEFHLDDPKFKKFLSKGFIPDWNVHYRYWFDQTFPAHSTTTVQYASILYDGNGRTTDGAAIWYPRYHLSPEQKVARLQDVLDYHHLTPYLSGKALMDKTRERHGEHPYGSADVYWNSVFLGATKWQHPIGLLRVEYATAWEDSRQGEMVVFCLDGKAHVETDNFALELTNYKPAEQPLTFYEFSFFLPEKW